MRIRRLAVAVAMGAMGLVAVRKLTGRGKRNEDDDIWDASPPPSDGPQPAAFAGGAPAATEAPAPAATEAAVPDPSAPSTGKIKGNVRSDGEKIYHMPGDAMYERTKAEQEFDSAEEAEAAGFRRVGSPRAQSDDA